MDPQLKALVDGLFARLDAINASTRANAPPREAISLPQRSAKQHISWTVTRTVGTVAAKILSANPRRWSVLFCVTQSGTGYALANQEPANLNQPALIFDDPAVSQFRELDYPKYGALVGQEWWGYGLAAGGSVVAVEVVLDQ